MRFPIGVGFRALRAPIGFGFRPIGVGVPIGVGNADRRLRSALDYHLAMACGVGLPIGIRVQRLVLLEPLGMDIQCRLLALEVLWGAWVWYVCACMCVRVSV